MAAGGGSFTIRDYSNETSNVSFKTGVITAGNLAGVLTQFGALRTAIDAIILGVVAREDLYVTRSNVSNATPASTNAQRERKWLVQYRDNTAFFDDPTNAIPNEGYGKAFVVEIPTADLGLTDAFPLNSDEVDLGQTQIAAFITAFEALVKSPHGGTPEVYRITHVGRST